MKQTAAVPRPVAAAILMAVLAILFWRKPEALTRPQFYAEDGLIFFLDAYVAPLRSLLHPYQGYSCLASRLVALVCSPLPARLMPAAFAWSAAALTLGVAAFALSKRIPLPAYARCAMALAVVGAPTGDEVYSCLTNSQWILALSLILVAVARPPETKAQAVFDAAVVACVGLNGPFSLLFIPLFAFRLATQRTRHALLLFLLAVAAGVLQARHLPGSRIPGPALGLRFLLDACGIPAWDMFILGHHDPGPIIIYFAACTGLLWIFLALRALRRNEHAVPLFIAAAAIMLASEVWAYRAQPALVGTPRYVYLPMVLTMWAVVAALHPILSAATFLLIGYHTIVTVQLRAVWPDLRWSERSACIGTGAPCTVPIMPQGWSVTMPGANQGK